MIQAKKKIFVLHPHFTIAGGAGNFVLEVGSRLADRGYQVDVCCIRADHSLVASFNDKIKFIEVGGALSSSLKHWLLLPYFLFKVFKICDHEKPDILFPQVFPSNWWGFIYKLFRPKTKLLWMCQEPSAFIHSKAWINAIRDPLMSTILNSLNPFLKIIDHKLAKQADFVFANSNYGARYAAEVYGYPADKLQPLYLGVSSAFLSTRDVANFSSRKCQIVSVCRLTKFKNVHLIIEAVAALKKAFPQILLKIVGRGEEESALRQLVEKLDCNNNVEFCGALPLPELVNTLSSSRAFVLASVDEPFGLVVVEAMACGTPAVVVESGGPSEIVENNRSGFHIPANDNAALIARLEQLLSNETLFNSTSLNAKVRAKEFDWELTTSKIEAQLEKLLR